MTLVMNGFSPVTNTSLIFGERRNRLKGIWDILFGDRPKEWISFKPTLGAYVYPCYVCRHMFSSFFSLQDHINRRIIVLKYNCSSCPGEPFTFYNRCALLLHARLHYSMEEGQINLSEIDNFTLPVDLAGFLPLPNIPSIYEREEPTTTDNIYVNVQFYVPSNDQKGKQVVVLKPDDFIYKDNNVTLTLKQICKNIPKCQFITIEEQKRLKERALLTDTNGVDLSANIKVELFDYVDQFTLPVISKVESLHEKTYNIPRCLDCNSIHNGTMVQHYQGTNKPLDPDLTCSQCKFVASTKCSYRAHIRIHNSEAPHVCPDCGKDFENSQILRKHLEEVCFHLAKNVKYRCPGRRCSKLFASQANFAVHFKQHFKCAYTCDACNTMLFSMEDLEDHIVFHNGNCTFTRIFECSVCTDHGAIGESEYDAHIDMHTKNDAAGMYVYLCRHCRNFFRSTGTFAAHLLKCTSKMIAESFGDTKRAGSKPKFVVTKKYFCVLCNEQIPLEKKVSHMKLCKYAHPVILVDKLSDVYVNDLYGPSSESNTSCDSKRSKSDDSPRSEENGKKRRKRYLTDISRRRRPEIAPDLIAEKPIEFDGTYHCKLCEYHSVERSDFHSHIRTHRNISTAYQCMECGECFVVKPSLIKHLLHFHNISDYESYLKDNDCFDVVAVKELENVMRLAPGESKGPVKQNQCRVCLQEFADSSTLDKHYRTHGMAFLLKNSK